MKRSYRFKSYNTFTSFYWVNASGKERLVNNDGYEIVDGDEVSLCRNEVEDTFDIPHRGPVTIILTVATKPMPESIEIRFIQDCWEVSYNDTDINPENRWLIEPIIPNPCDCVLSRQFPKSRRLWVRCHYEV